MGENPGRTSICTLTLRTLTQTKSQTLDKAETSWIRPYAFRLLLEIYSCWFRLAILATPDGRAIWGCKGVPEQLHNPRPASRKNRYTQMPKPQT